jgi:GntR family transcriptional regulator, regulator for abcA and norABC
LKGRVLLDWNVDRSSKKPLYKQIAEHMEHCISEGTLIPEKPLPAERNLAIKLQVNRSTVVSAYDELEAMGLIERIKGKGTFICKDIWGNTRRRIPSWNRYIEAGSFLPNLPVTQRIRKEMEEHHLINLASGELSEDLFSAKSLYEMISNRCFVGRLGYDHPQGNAILRDTITNHVNQYRNIQTNPSSILITSGAQQALHLVVQCLLKPGDAVAIENPSYNYSLPIFQSAGIKTFHLPVNKNGINPDDLLLLHKKHRIRMIFLNPNFQNPTGTLLDMNSRRKILDISSQHGIPIIEDDPYSLTSFDGESISTLKSLDQHGNVLYISSMSKIVASGLRIGWIIGPKQVIERLSDAKQQVDFGHGTYSQWIANEILNSNTFDNHIHFLRNELKKRSEEIARSLLLHLENQVEFDIPNGGIHLWCKINKEVNEKQLLEMSIKKGIIYVPGYILGSEKGLVRFTFAREKEEAIREGIKRFADALNKI